MPLILPANTLDSGYEIGNSGLFNVGIITEMPGLSIIIIYLFKFWTYIVNFLLVFLINSQNILILL